jgi:hypothetical protein
MRDPPNTIIGMNERKMAKGILVKMMNTIIKMHEIAIYRYVLNFPTFSTLYCSNGSNSGFNVES